MTDTPQKHAFIRTYGCQMNVYDSERMAEALSAKGYAATDDVTQADSSSSTPATSASGRPRRSIPSSGAFGP